MKKSQIKLQIYFKRMKSNKFDRYTFNGDFLKFD